MKKLLGVAFAAGLAFLPVSAFAADSAQGVVKSVDVVTGVFVIHTDKDAKEMGFTVSEKLDFDELALESGERIVIEYDQAQCAGKTTCISTATKVTRPKS